MLLRRRIRTRNFRFGQPIEEVGIADLGDAASRGLLADTLLRRAFDGGDIIGQVVELAVDDASAPAWPTKRSLRA